MANFSYKKVTTTNLKASGTFDTYRMVIEVNGEEKKLSTLLSDFNGGEIEINIKVKSEEELDPPESPDEEDEEDEG